MTTNFFQKTGLHYLLKNYFFFIKEVISENQAKTLNNNELNKCFSDINADKNTDYDNYKDIYLAATRWQTPTYESTKR